MNDLREPAAVNEKYLEDPTLLQKRKTDPMFKDNENFQKYFEAQEKYIQFSKCKSFKLWQSLSGADLNVFENKKRFKSWPLTHNYMYPA